jgi:hypothetical protein
MYLTNSLLLDIYAASGIINNAVTKDLVHIFVYSPIFFLKVNWVKNLYMAVDIQISTHRICEYVTLKCKRDFSCVTSEDDEVGSSQCYHKALQRERGGKRICGVEMLHCSTDGAGALRHEPQVLHKLEMARKQFRHRCIYPRSPSLDNVPQP